MNFKEVIKKIVYSQLVYGVCSLLAWLSYICAKNIDRKSFWCLYLLVAKLQITIGYRSGLFSYIRHKPYSMSAIEKRVADAAARLDINADTNTNNQQPVSETILFATSFVAQTGGHTRLLQTYLSRMPDAKLLISGDAFCTGRQCFLAEQELLCSTLFKGAGNRIIFNRDSRLSLCWQIESLYKQLSTLNPKVIVLFNEFIDLALPVAALIYSRRNIDARVYYCHHAGDFLPFMGSAFQGHIDLVCNQEITCKDTLNRSLIRISTKNRKAGVVTVKKPFTVFSFAPMAKLVNKNTGSEQYSDLVAALSKKGVRFIIATKNGEGERLKNLLALSGTDMAVVTIDEQCFEISKYAGLIHAYLDTFPIGGGLSIVDALSLGMPAMINAQFGHGVFMDDVIKEFMFPNSAKIISYLMRLQNDADFYRLQCQRAHQVFMESYDESAMVSALRKVIVSEGCL